MSKYVWYACYGSNMSSARFKEYIDRCSDNTFPSESREYQFSFPIYFGSNSRRWGGGTAFLNINASGRSLGRLYMITEEQFEQVKRFEGPKYSKRIDLEPVDGIPTYTFTSAEPQERRAPSFDYFNVILTGMQETFPYLDESVLGHFLASSILSEEEFVALSTIRAAEHGLSAVQVSEARNVNVNDTASAINRLIRNGLLRQDSRTIHYSAEHPSACFYTDRSMRGLIDQIINYRSVAGTTDPFIQIRAFSTDYESVCEAPEDTTENDYEGRRILYYTTRYERSPRNREEAIRIHGTKCQVCGFDFSEIYGEIGQGFIEVHHVVPLHDKNAVVQIDPETDLVCLCANCHRMIHRAPNGVFTVEELKRIIRHT